MLSVDDYRYIFQPDFMSFTERSFYELNPQTPFFTAPYIELIVSKLEAVRRGQVKRLIINLPPRQLKSHSASIAFVAWLLGHDATKHVICASYGQDLANKLARDCRNIMNASWYKELFPTWLSERKAVNDFTTIKQGTRMATSVGGVLTGRGADIIIIDDPLKPDDALSETKRNAVNEWYDNTLLSRLNDKTAGASSFCSPSPTRQMAPCSARQASTGSSTGIMTAFGTLFTAASMNWRAVWLFWKRTQKSMMLTKGSLYPAIVPTYGA